MKNINITINDQKIKVPEGTTILEAARLNGIEIPTLCAYEGMGPHAACRLCMVEAAGCDRLLPACRTKAAEGMEIETETPALIAHRKTMLRLRDWHCRAATVCPLTVTANAARANDQH